MIAARKPVSWIDESMLELGANVGRGGEGQIWAVINQPGQVYKRYGAAPSDDLVTKLEWMAANPPEAEALERLTWPTELVRAQDGRLCGYLMRRLPEATVSIHAAFTGNGDKIRQKLGREPFDLRDRHIIARNLVSVIQACHQSGYVIGDLNHNNVQINPQGHVTLIDNDSFQATLPDGTVHLFNGGVAPGYQSPELRPLPAQVPVSHDVFLVAVMTFRLLMQSVHPFQGECDVPEGEDPPDEIQLIRREAYPYDLRRLNAWARPHGDAPALARLHRDVVDGFQRSFADGLMSPGLRPSLDQWSRILDTAVPSLVRCRRGHWYSADRAWCLAKSGTGGYCASSSSVEGQAFPGRIVDALTGDVALPDQHPVSWIVDASSLPHLARARWTLADSRGVIIDSGSLGRASFSRIWHVREGAYIVRVTSRDGRTLAEETITVTGQTFHTTTILPATNRLWQPIRIDWQWQARLSRFRLSRFRPTWRWPAQLSGLERTWRDASRIVAGRQQALNATWEQALRRAATAPVRLATVLVGALLLVQMVAPGGVAGVGRGLLQVDAGDGDGAIGVVGPEGSGTGSGDAEASSWVIIANTGGSSLWLNARPNGGELALYPEGTILEVLDPVPVQAGRFWWQHVRAPDGREGWVAGDYIVPASPD